MSSFRAINVPSVPKQLSDSLRKDAPFPGSEDEELPEVSTFIKRRSEAIPQNDPSGEEPSDICGRNWDVAKIINRKAEGGQLKYLTRWVDSVLLAKDIRHRADGTNYVRCDGKDWDVLTDRPAELSGDNGTPQRLVEWKDSWRSVEDLVEGAQGILESIQEFEVRRLERGPSSGSDSQHEFVGNKLRPAKDVDYSRVARTTLREIDGIMNPQRQRLMEMQPVRPLLVRDDFVDKGRLLDLKKEHKGNASLVFVTGYEQLAPCDRCVRECGPFTKCVVGEEFSNGACANCAYGGKSTECNFHQTPNQGIERRRPVKKRLARESQPQDMSPLSTASSQISPPNRSSVALLDDAPQLTNPTSPIPTPSSPYAPVAHRGPSPELGTPLFPLPREQRPGDTSLQRKEGNASQVKDKAVLAPLSSSGQNSKSRGLSQSRSEKTGGGETLPETTSERDNGPEKNDICSTLSLRAPPANDSANSSAPEQSRSGKRKRSSNLPLEMPPGALTVQHDGCAGGNTPCSDAKASYNIAFSFMGSSRICSAVYRHMRFDSEEATAAQISFIISQCPCSHTEWFEQAWENYCAERIKKGEKNRYTKESYLSKRFPQFINAVVNAYCPIDPDAEAEIGWGSALDPICIED